MKTSWLQIPENSDFTLYNVPFGVIKINSNYYAATCIGDTAINLFELAQLGAFKSIKGFNKNTLNQQYLNDFIALGKQITNAVREEIINLFDEKNGAQKQQFAKALLKLTEAKNTLPIKIGDYTDFYSSIDHATNIGKMIRDPANALMPNWKHLPVAYHGRASSICVSGHSFYRPKGQKKPADADAPIFGQTNLLDFELETGFIIGKSTTMGDSITTQNASDYIFGKVLFNDWSARDIQTWEYVPLGPFLAKNFASTISPWIITIEALEPFKVEGYKQIPEVLPYLQYKGFDNYDINLEVIIETQQGVQTSVCQSNYKYMYWTMTQQLAHHSVNGCNVNVGDLMGSGTISGPQPHEFGSLMELTWKGANPIKLNDGTERKFINDNDSVIIKGYAQKGNIRVGFGECKSTVLPTK